MERSYDDGLETLFALVGAALESESALISPSSIGQRRLYPPRDPLGGQGDLFSDPGLGVLAAPALPERTDVGPPGLGKGVAAELRAVSPAAYDDVLHAWLSERPVEAALEAFTVGLLTAARNAQSGDPRKPLPVEPSESARDSAERERTDRGKLETADVLAAADSTRVEFHRLLGLLRFRPSAEGPYLARCSPDHLVLPLMGVHFAERFGDADWAVVDERRCLALVRISPETVRLSSFDPEDPPFAPAEGLWHDEIESLWRGYYQGVNIGTRINPSLRRRLMPVRYWKYLVEL